MRSNLPNTFFMLVLATVLVVSEIVGCNVRQSPDKKDGTLTTELADKYNEGKELFSKYCNKCHMAPDKKATDQWLFENLFNRLPSDYVIKYINNSRKLKLSGDKYAIAVAEAYNSTYDHLFKDSLSDIEFDNLIIYMKAATH